MKPVWTHFALAVAVAAVVWTVSVYATRKYITQEMPQ